MKFLKKIASASEAVQKDYNVLYATDTEVKLVKPLPTYTVTFKDYDDSVISTKTYKQGETVTVPSNPTREGYDFSGWSPTVSPTAVADAVYTAQYEEAKPTVETVDLGLPSGTKWMKYNVGAESETEYGLLFQWGATEGHDYDTDAKDYTSWDTCPWGSSTPPMTTLDAEHDAVTAKYGSGYCMPTKAQLEELTANTTVEWTSMTASDGSTVYGGKFTASNGNYIFIPASGYAVNGSVYSRGSNGYVWSSSLRADGPSYAWDLRFNSGRSGVFYDYRYYGYSIRGVVSKN